MLQEYDFDFKYKPGKDNIVPDALSRRPDLKDDPSMNIQLNSVDVQLEPGIRQQLQDGYTKDIILGPLMEKAKTPHLMTTTLLPTAYFGSTQVTTHGYVSQMTPHSVLACSMMLTIPPLQDISALRKRMKICDKHFSGHAWLEILRNTSPLVSNAKGTSRNSNNQQGYSNLLPYHASAGTLSQWTLSLNFPRLHGDMMPSPLLSTNSPSKYIFALATLRTQQQTLLDYSSTKSSAFMGCHDKSYRIGIHDLQESSGRL